MVSTPSDITQAPISAPVKSNGFAIEVDTNSATYEKTLEWDAKSIPLDQLRVETTSIRDIPPGEMPLLPIGLFLKEGKKVSQVEANGNGHVEDDEETGHESYERLRQFTVHPEVGKGLFSKALGKLESKGMNNPKTVIQALAKFLGVGHENCPPAIETIGGRPLKEVARAYGNSAQRMFEEMPIPDIATMMIGVRLATRGRDYAATMNCPVRNCSNVCKELCSMDELNIRSIPILNNKPVFRVELEHGIFDGKSTVRKVYFTVLKLHQIGIYFKQNITAPEMLQEHICAIPESELFGLSKNSRPFSEDLFDALEPSGEDQRTLIQALQKLRFGPDNGFKITCECGDRQLSYPLPWSMQPQEFLYLSNMFPEIED
jgi:hypothetical protein